MADFLAGRIIGGYLTFDEVPDKFKREVAEILHDKRKDHLITLDKYRKK